MTASRDARYPLALLAVFATLWLVLAIRPLFREDWLLENLLVFVTLPLAVLAWRRGRLTHAACTLLFAMYVLHAVGAHYTYALVPYDEWLRDLTGRGLGERLGWQRNHYDRLVHLAYGVLLWLPYAELVGGAWRLPRRAAGIASVTLIVATSGAYELVEWGAAVLFGGDLGAAYLGTQGDVWDAQKDMALAAAGAVAAACADAVALLWRRSRSGAGFA